MYVHVEDCEKKKFEARFKRMTKHPIVDIRGRYLSISIVVAIAVAITIAVDATTLYRLE